MLGRARLESLTWRPLGRRTATLRDLNLTVRPGERVLLVGRSGAGKSSVLHAMVGALGASIPGDLSGRIDVAGRIGLLLQNPVDSLVAEHIGRDVAFGPENLGLARAEIWRRVDAALAAVGLHYGRSHFTSALSGGEQQRLALAGVLATEPDVLLLDEPTSMLDAGTAAGVRDAVLTAAAGRTLIVAEHRLEPWLSHVHRVVALGSGGAIEYDGPVAGFLASPPPPGVWMPGLAAPSPVGVPFHLVDPQDRTVPVTTSDVAVDLVTRTLRGTQRTRAVRRLSAAIQPGDVTAFTGPSGAGKSTVLEVFAGVLKPSTGTVSPALATWTSRRLASAVGWVPQNPELGFLTASVADEVVRTAGVAGRTVDAAAVLEVFGLSHLAKVNPYRLSGGEQRRLALAAALAHRPGVMLLDEPTVGQDRDTWAAVVGWLTASAGAGANVAVSTHDADLPVDVSHPVRQGVVG